MKIKLSCFRKLYSPRAKECQICLYAETCCKKSPVKRERLNAVSLAIINILASSNGCELIQLQKELSILLPKQSANIYPYINSLKMKNYIGVRVKGRKRVYYVK